MSDQNLQNETPVTPSEAARAEFNTEAAKGVYERANALVRDTGAWASFKQMFNENADINIDETLRTADVDVSLDAFVAGYKGTSAEAQTQTFVDTIRRHPELKAGLEAVLQDEGENVLDGVKELATGNGAIDMNQFSEAMDSPERRALFAGMLDQVATNKFGVDYALRFSRDAMAAGQNPRDGEAVERFRQTAQLAGLNLAGVEQETMMDSLSEFFKNPQQFITQFIDSLDFLPQDMKEMFTGLMNGVAGFYQDAIGHYAYGDGNNPGLVQIAQSAGASLSIEGREDRAQYLPQPVPTV